MAVQSQRKYIPENLESKLAQTQNEEWEKRKGEFDTKYKDELIKQIWWETPENIEFTKTIANFFERYWDKKTWLGDIEIAIKEAFKQIKWSSEFNEEILTLIKSLKEKNKDGEKKEKENIKDLNWIKYNPNYPIIERLLEEWLIEDKDIEKLTKIEDKDTFKNEVLIIIWKIKNNNELKISLQNFVNWLDKNWKKRKYTKENFTESDFFKDFSWNIDTKPDKDDPLDIIIANNYFKFPEKKDTKRDIKLDNLYTSLDIVKNKIIENWLNLSSSFIERNAEIIAKIEKTNNIWEKYALVKQLFSESKKEWWIKEIWMKNNIKPWNSIEKIKWLKELIRKHIISQREKIDWQQKNSANFNKLKWYLAPLDWLLEELKIKMSKWFISGADWLIKEAEAEIERNLKNPDSFNEWKIENLIAKTNELLTSKN